MLLKNILNSWRDAIFPLYCVGCAQEGGWCCEPCLAKLKNDHIPACPVCQERNAAGEVCQNCSSVSGLDGVSALFEYSEEGAAGKLIKQFKYNYARGIEDVWKKVVSVQSDAVFGKISRAGDISVIPVPLHPRRERERGFNQSEILAKILSDQSSLYLDNTSLRRVRYTRQQARLSGEQRRGNLLDAFCWVSKKTAPDSVLLVDDVFTTGTTMQECARVLKQAGARQVWGWALARG